MPSIAVGAMLKNHPDAGELKYSEADPSCDRILLKLKHSCNGETVNQIDKYI